MDIREPQIFNSAPINLSVQAFNYCNGDLSKNLCTNTKITTR